MATIRDIIAARDDADLRERCRTAAQTLGMQWNDEENLMGQIVARKVGDGTQTLADVYAFSVSQHQPFKNSEGRMVQYVERPGGDPNYVTDPLIFEAVEKVRSGAI